MMPFLYNTHGVDMNIQQILKAYAIAAKGKCPICGEAFGESLDYGDDEEISTCGTCAVVFTINHATKTVTQG